MTLIDIKCMDKAHGFWSSISKRKDCAVVYLLQAICFHREIERNVRTTSWELNKQTKKQNPVSPEITTK